jgi:hypothetical protein
MLKKRTRRKVTAEQSDGDVAWKHRYIDLNERYLNIHEDIRILCGLHSLGSHEEAHAMCGNLLDRFDRELTELVKC